jgi:hypothetical protein
MKYNNNNNNNNKRLFCQLLWNHSIFSFLIMFLLTDLILWNSVNISYSQNLSSSSSIKANAGEDQYVEEGKPVILNGEDSVSSDPPIDSFNWIQIEPKTPIIDLENSNTSRASFTSPNLPSDGYFIFGLIVRDQNLTDTDTVNVYVVEDLASIDKEITGDAGYQPEICFDGADNDLDGKIDLQDEECGLTFSPGSPIQGPEGPLPPQPGGIPFYPNIQPGLPPGPLPPGPLPPGPGQPGELSPGPGQPGELSPGQ